MATAIELQRRLAARMRPPAFARARLAAARDAGFAPLSSLPTRFVRRTIIFPDAITKAQWMQGAAFADASRPEVIAWSRYVCGEDFQSSPIRCAMKLQTWVRDAIEWVQDPDHVETLEDSATTLRRGWNDCDGKARLFVAMARAAGVDAELRPIFDDLDTSDPEDFIHVQARVRVPGSDRVPYAEPGGWIIVEVTLADVPLGAGAESRSTKDSA